MKTTAFAIVLAMLVPVSGAFAQEANTDDMMKGLTMLETNVSMAFQKYGIEANPMTLTLGQLGLIERVLNDPDADHGGNSKKDTIAFIVSMR